MVIATIGYYQIKIDKIIWDESGQSSHHVDVL